MFYEIYEKLCSENGEKPYQLPLKLGAKSNSVVAQWQKGSVPRGAMLQKIANHFNVTVEYLLTGDDKTENAPTLTDGRELPHTERREILAGQGVRIMLDADAKLTDAQLEDIINFIEFQQEKYGR